MHYDSVLHYVRRLLENSHIASVICDESFENWETLDRGLRLSLMPDYDKQKAFQLFVNACKPNVLYYITDRFFCSYVCLMLPHPEKHQYFLIGPFTYTEMNQENYCHILKTLNIPSQLLPFTDNYYYHLPFIQSEALFKNIIGTLADTIWGSSKDYKISESNEYLFDLSYPAGIAELITSPSYMIPLNAQAVEARYATESQYMQIISQGNIPMMEQLLSKEEHIRYVPRLVDSLRDYKNYLIVLNTLLRKAAQMGAVHPVYLDQISTKYAKKIEALTTAYDRTLMREMFRQYCLLVHNYSVKGYSPILQKVINQINLNLTSDLSLKTLSEMFNISAGYLSMLFKKETGVTLTDYVNKKRTEHAIFLLNTTNLQIQTIASYCGIDDINYFTRIFKKFHGMTPKAYKEMIAKHHHSSKQ